MKTTLLYIILILSFSFLSAQENGGPYSPDNNTVLLMHFEGDATNSSGVGNDGVVQGSGVSYETGVHGQALRLDNSTADKQSWIEIPFFDELNFTEEFSIECWFKINSWGENASESISLFKKEANNGALEYETVLNAETKTGQISLY